MLTRLRKLTGVASPAIDPAAIDPNDDSGIPPESARPRRSAGLTPDGRLRSGRLAGLSMRRAIWVLSWPILIESFLNSAVGLTDTMLAAQLSTEATDAIGGASYLMWFVGLIAMAVGVGATALVSRAVGASRLAVAHAATAQAILLGLLAGAVTGLILVVIAPVTAQMLSLSPAAASDFTAYLRIIALGTPALAVIAAGIAAARGAGDSLRPLWAMVIVNGVNIAASWLLSGADYSRVVMQDGVATTHTLITNPSPFNLGVVGLAWGTVIGEVVGAVFIVLMLTRGWTTVRLKRARLRPHWHTIRRLLKVAIPNFLETFGLWAGNFLVILIVGLIAQQRAAAATGLAETGVMGSHIVAVRIESFSYLPGFAMGVAAAALAGQYLGAGAPLLARRAVRRCSLAAAAIMGFAGLVFILIPRTLVGLVSSQPIHLELAPTLLLIAGFVQVPFAMSNVLRAALRGTGDSRAVMYIMWVCTYFVRLPLVIALSGIELPLPGGRTLPALYPEPSLAMLWVALCAEIVIRWAMLAARFRTGAWLRARV